MALITCYDADGKPHQKEPVDARECCKHCGYSMTPPDGDVPMPSAAQQAADAMVREAAKATQVVIADPAPEKRAYHRKTKD